MWASRWNSLVEWVADALTIRMPARPPTWVILRPGARARLRWDTLHRVGDVPAGDLILAPHFQSKNMSRPMGEVD